MPEAHREPVTGALRSDEDRRQVERRRFPRDEFGSAERRVAERRSGCDRRDEDE
jgi:hypothetical protein